MADGLMPCPFCGRTPPIEQVDEHDWVVFHACGKEGESTRELYRRSKAALVRGWNRRAK